MPAWSVTAELSAEEADDRAALLVDEGASGVEVRDGTVAPMPGVPQPPPGRALVVAYFEREDRAREVAATLGGTAAAVPEQDWGEAWKKGLEAFAIGRVFIRPSWVERAPPEGTVEIVLDPGMAFGTGTHGTTALCLAAIDAILAGRPGASVLDVGTGSGLLAIAAAKLGAGRVAGIDNDPVAVRVALGNARANRVRVEISDAPLRAVAGRFDLVVANILANTLVELAPALAAKLDARGVLLLSGILAPQEGEVRAAHLAAGLVPDEPLCRRHGEWSLLAFRAAP